LAGFQKRKKGDASHAKTRACHHREGERARPPVLSKKGGPALALIRKTGDLMARNEAARSLDEKKKKKKNPLALGRKEGPVYFGGKVLRWCVGGRKGYSDLTKDGEKDQTTCRFEKKREENCLALLRGFSFAEGLRGIPVHRLEGRKRWLYQEKICAIVLRRGSRASHLLSPGKTSTPLHPKRRSVGDYVIDEKETRPLPIEKDNTCREEGSEPVEGKRKTPKGGRVNRCAGGGSTRKKGAL